MADLLVSLLDVVQLDAGVLGQGQNGLLAKANDENVSKSCGEMLASRVSNMGDIKRARVLLNVGEDSDSSDRVSLCDVNIGPLFELENGVDISGVKVEL